MSQSIKKKLMALVVVGVLAIPMASFAQENQAVVISERVQQENEYINYSGEIIEVIDKVIDNDGNISIHVNSGAEVDQYGMVFHISDNVSLWNRETEELVKAKDLKEGMSVEVFFHQHTPTTMSLPPQLTPAAIVIQKEGAGEPTYMGKFDQGLTSSDNFLKLNIGKDTVIVNQKGEKLAQQDLYDQTALVFFGMSTKSIPAQTTPSKIIIFTGKEEVVDEDITENDSVAQEMIELRAIATELGYKVQWNNKDKTATLTKQNQTITLKSGSVDYTLNKSLGKFTKAPELKNGTLYVSASILDLMN